MKLFLIILFVATAFMLLLCLMPVKIKFKLLRKENDDYIRMRVYTLYGLIHHTFELPSLDIVFVNNRPALKYKAKLEKSKTNKLLKSVSKIFSVDDFNNIKKYFRHDSILLRQLYAYWSKKLLIRDFGLRLQYGLEDAALAAVLYGMGWTLLGTLVSAAENNFNFTTKELVIEPAFDRQLFAIEFSCIIKFKFGNIINTGIMVLKRVLERRKASQAPNKDLNMN